MNSLHISQQAFAEFLGISSATLSSIFTGRTKVTLNTIMAIKEKYPSLNYNWLIDGTGPMFNDKNSGSDVANQDSASGTPTLTSASSDEAFLDFGDGEDTDASSASTQAQVKNSSSTRQQILGSDASAASSLLGKNQQQNQMVIHPKIINNIHHSVSQILVIYDDQTCETFVPQKSSSTK